MEILGNIYNDKLESVGIAPGYRDISLTITLMAADKPKETVTLRLSKKDAQDLMVDLLKAFALAWTGKLPLDFEQGERQPRFLEGKLPQDFRP